MRPMFAAGGAYFMPEAPTEAPTLWGAGVLTGLVWVALC